MSTARESRADLVDVSAAAVDLSAELLIGLDGAPEVRRAALLESVPDLIGYFTDGTAALAVDFYDEERVRQAAAGSFAAEAIVADRTVKIRRAIAWSAAPLFDGDDSAAQKRLAEVVQFEVAQPYRDTILTNQRRDPESSGWMRIASAGCGFCRMLAAKGAIYRKDTVHFAAHPHCSCTAAPVFRGNVGQEASVMQYMATKRRRSAAEKQRLREYIAEYYPD